MSLSRQEQIKQELKELNEWAEILDPANPIEGQQLDRVLTSIDKLEAELARSLADTQYAEKRSKFTVIKGGKE